MQLSAGIKVLRLYLAGLLDKSRFQGPIMKATEIPVSYMWYVFAMLWAEQAGISRKDIIEANSFEILNLFKEYVTMCDYYIDEVLKDEKQLTVKSGEECPYVKNSRKALTMSITGTVPDDEKKRKILGLVKDFHEKSIQIVEKRRDTVMESLDDVLEYKMNTSGRYCRASIMILDILHDIPEGKSKELEDSAQAAGMCVQLKDDVRDLHEDYGRSANILAAVMREHPQEEGVIREKIMGGSIRLSWLRRHAPETNARVRGLFAGYRDDIKFNGMRDVASFAFKHIIYVPKKDRRGLWNSRDTSRILASF